MNPSRPLIALSLLGAALASFVASPRLAAAQEEPPAPPAAPPAPVPDANPLPTLPPAAPPPDAAPVPSPTLAPVNDAAPVIAPLTLTPQVDVVPARRRQGGTRVSFGGSIGYASGYISHPDLGVNRLRGPLIELDVGVAVTPSWTVGVGFSTVEMRVERGNDGMGFVPPDLIVPSSLQIQAANSKPSKGGGGTGGIVVALPIHVHTLGPRVEFAPWGGDSFYFGVTAGAAVVQALSTRVGGAAAARAGYRIRPVDAVGLSIEAGAHGQVYDAASAAFPFAAAQVRLYLPGFGAK